jgi:hypothetical protein
MQVQSVQGYKNDNEADTSFRTKSRTKIIKKLCERTQGEVDEMEMAKRLDSGELKQFCIELTGIDDSKLSHDFADTVLERQGSPYAESVQTRREGIEGTVTRS